MEEVKPSVSVRSVGIKFGIIAGLIGLAQFLIVALVGGNPFHSAWGWFGAALAITTLFLAHKEFKDEGDGFMAYGQGIAIAFWYAVIAVLITVPIMYVFLTFIDPGVMELFYDQQLAKMQEQGQPEQAIEMGMMWTRKLYWIFAIIVPFFFDMIIALILTIFTHKKKIEQTF
jgi:hypothetical protein